MTTTESSGTSGGESVLITGANGFIGQRTLQRVGQMGFRVTAATRSIAKQPWKESWTQILEDGELADPEMLNGCRAIIHLAGRAHVLKEDAANPLEAFRRANVNVTEKLARRAAAHGVGRFIYVSSIGVNGSETMQRPFRSTDDPAPHSFYAISKYEAEQRLWQISATSALQVVVVRPPLVYGPDAPGNFGRLLHWLYQGRPLPLGAVRDNLRSLVALDNLVDLLVTCIDHRAAANRTFLVSDGEDLSTTDLLRRMGVALGKPAHLLPVPPRLLRWGAALVGRSDAASSLLGNLQVDIGSTCELLHWAPPISVDEGLLRAAQGLRQ